MSGNSRSDAIETESPPSSTTSLTPPLSVTHTHGFRHNTCSWVIFTTWHNRVHSHSAVALAVRSPPRTTTGMCAQCVSAIGSVSNTGRERAREGETPMRAAHSTPAEEEDEGRPEGGSGEVYKLGAAGTMSFSANQL
eukprot:6181300-Pleurochrysis_carterae.AAC.4